jgi:hypothetical protein
MRVSTKLIAPSNLAKTVSQAIQQPQFDVKGSTAVP